MGAVSCLQFPSNGIGKVVGDGPSVWGPATRVGDLDEIPDL